MNGGLIPGREDDDCEGDDDDEEEYAEEDELEESEEEEEEEDDDDDDDDEDSINGDDLALAVDRTMLKDQAMLAGTKIAAQDMVNAAAAALKDTTPVKPAATGTKPVDSPLKSSPEAFGDSSAEKVQGNGNLEELKLGELDVVVDDIAAAVAGSAEKAQPPNAPPKQEEGNKENLSSGEKKPEENAN